MKRLYPTVLCTVVLLVLGMVSPRVLGQDDLLFENQIDGYAQINSLIFPGGTSYETADDFTVSGTIERVWIYGGNCCLTTCSFPTDIVEVTVRFYADDDGQPGELLAEHVLDGDDPNFIWNEATGPTLLDITLPEPFLADGSYFISAQPEFTTFFCWGWWTSHNNNPIGSAMWTRFNGGPWEPYQGGIGVLNADLAFALIGTQGVPDPPQEFVEDGCDSDWQEIEVPDFQPGEAGIPELVEGVTNTLNDLVILSPTEVWAVGDYGYSNLGSSGGESFALTMFFDGEEWTPVPAPSPENFAGEAIAHLDAVDAVSSNEVYACGSAAQENNSSVFILRWDGSEWEQLFDSDFNIPTDDAVLLHDVEVLDGETIWFAGGGEIGPGLQKGTLYRYDGDDFELFTTPVVSNAAHRLRAVSALSADDVWAAGATGGIAVAVGASYVVHWDGSSWEHIPTPHPGVGEILRDIVAIAPDDVWACGRYNIIPDGGGPVIPTPLFLHWDGQQWEQFESPAFASDLVVINSDRIYGVSGEKLVYWNGEEWGLVGDLDDDLENIGLGAIGAFDDCNFLAVGAAGGAFKDTRAARYIPQPPPGDLDGNGTIGTSDLLLLLAAWGPCDDCSQDLDGDGAVGTGDLLLLLANWG